MKPAGSQTWHAEGKESTFLDNNFHSSFCISWCKSHCFNRAFGSDWLFSARALPSTTKAKHHWEEKVPSISLTVDLKWSYRESRGKLIRITLEAGTELLVFSLQNHPQFHLHCTRCYFPVARILLVCTQLKGTGRLQTRKWLYERTQVILSLYSPSSHGSVPEGPWASH